MTDRECVAFLQWALPRLRMRWPGYRKVRRQVCKRVSRRMAELAVADAEEYRTFLQEHPQEWDRVDSFCRITISRFFRDREVFHTLRDEILPALAEAALAEGRLELRCWSAGCGSGEEPYTLNLLWRLPADGSLSCRLDRISLLITATDSDPTVLERARSAVYPRGPLKEVPESWLPLAFDNSKDDFVLRSPFKEGVRFQELDVRREAPEGALDLILCRNLVFTYFEESLQVEILHRFLDRLRHGGCLVTGGHERLPAGEWPLRRLSSGLPIYLREDGLEQRTP